MAGGHSSANELKAAKALPLPTAIARSVRDELWGCVRDAHLSPQLENAVLEALGGPTRVLPEGKPNLCAALTYLSYCSVIGSSDPDAPDPPATRWMRAAPLPLTKF